MGRPDLLALSDDSMSALANRGIVKRAVREVAEGKGPVLAEAEDGTISGTFVDGVEVTLPPGRTLEQGRCTCTASGVCRHRVMVVVAYREHDAAAAGAVPWSPASFSDNDLVALLGTRVLGIARKAWRVGYRARVRRASAGDPVPTVELASCTVRFLVPGELGYARVDAVRNTREDAVALAVWAFQAAEDVGAAAAAGVADVVDVAVGGAVGLPAAAAGSGLEPVLPVLADLLADGVVHTGPAAGAAIAQARRALDARNLRWPVDALDDVSEQLDAYRQRSARYRPEDAAGPLAEIVARHRCVAGGGASLRPAVLGTEEAEETPLRLLRLTGLGARVWGDDNTRSVEVYLAHGEAGVVLALRRRVEVIGQDDAEPPGGEEMGRRKAGGARLSALAAGNVVTQSAVRSASRIVRIAESRMAKTTVAPSSGAWEHLPAGILVDDLDAEAARLAGLAPGVVRPRIVAEAVHAVVVDDVEGVAYLPGDQRLLATIRAPIGRATVSLTHTSAAAGALDALAAALGGSHGPVRFVAGHLRRSGGEVVIEPTAVVAGDAVVVPGFIPAAGAAMSPSAEGGGGDAMAAAVAGALSVSADVVHRGWSHLPPGWAARGERSAEQLRGVGLQRASGALTNLCSATQAAPGAGALAIWADTHLRLLVTAEQL